MNKLSTELRWILNCLVIFRLCTDRRQAMRLTSSGSQITLMVFSMRCIRVPAPRCSDAGMRTLQQQLRETSLTTVAKGLRLSFLVVCRILLRELITGQWQSQFICYPIISRLKSFHLPTNIVLCRVPFAKDSRLPFWNNSTEPIAENSLKKSVIKSIGRQRHGCF